MLEWDADTGRPLRQIAGHGTVTDIGAFDDHDWEVSYNVAKVVSVLPVSPSAPERLLSLTHPAVRVRVSGDGTLLAAAAWDGSQAIVANAGSGAILANLQHGEWVDDAIPLSGSGNVLTLSRDGYLRSWRNPLQPAGQPRTVLEEGGPTVMARGSGGLVYLGGGGPALAEFDTASGMVHRIATLACKVPGLAASRCWITGLRVLQPGGDLLYAAADGRIGRIDPITGTSRWQTTLDAPISGFGVYPGEFRALVAVGADRLVGIDLGTGDIATPGPPGSYESGTTDRSIAFAPSSDRIATTDSRGIAIRRASDAAVVWRAPVYDRIALTAAWLPDEGLLAAGTAGDTIQLFPAHGGPPTRILRGHTSWVTGLSVRPGGRYLASVSNNEAIVWDILAGQAVLNIAHEANGGYTDVAFDADGKHLTLSDSTGSVRRVSVSIPNGDLKEALCRAIPSLGRSFSDAQMREFGFLSPADRSPCQRRPLLYHALLGGLFP